jgi:hypothetical protein
MPPAKTGFQPRNTPAERRAFYDQERQLTDVLARLAAAEATIADHEARIEVLEP